MEARKRILEEYVDVSGRNYFRKWLDGLRDDKTRAVIDGRMARIENGNLGDCEPVGEGVKEFRIDYGSGYRVYFGEDGKNIIILLAGGDKKSQRKDIEVARRLWNEYRNQ